MTKESYGMKRYKEQLRELTGITIFYKKLNIYNQFVFDAKQESQRKFIATNLILAIINMFLGFFSKPFILFGFGILFALMIYLFFDILFLKKWRGAIQTLRKNTK